MQKTLVARLEETWSKVKSWRQWRWLGWLILVAVFAPGVIDIYHGHVLRGLGYLLVFGVFFGGGYILGLGIARMIFPRPEMASHPLIGRHIMGVALAIYALSLFAAAKVTNAYMNTEFSLGDHSWGAGVFYAVFVGLVAWFLAKPGEDE